MSDDQIAIIQNQMRDESIGELLDFLPELGPFRGELRLRLREAVRGLNVFAAQRTHKLAFVIPGNREGMAVADHTHREAQNPRSVGSTVDEVTEEHHLSTFRMSGINRTAMIIPLDLVPQVDEKCFEL